MASKFGLPVTVVKNLCSIFAQYQQINRVIIYGSRAKGNYRNGSDIDLSIDGTVTMSQLLEIENKIDDLLLPWSVDLSILHQIENKGFVEHIKRCGSIFYQNERH